MQQDIKNLEVKQEATSQRCQALEGQYGRLATVSVEIPYLFMLPDKYEWFSGRKCELENLDSLLKSTETISETKVQIASVCGLGGTGKTSLAAEYAHRSKDCFGGGVFWFSGEYPYNFARSVEEHAVRFGISHDASPYRTLLETLEKISAIEKPWLLVLDNMDEFDLSLNIKILLSGPWKGTVKGSGHILITTRREPKVMGKIIRNFKESKCLQLGCFSPEDGKLFMFKRTGLICDSETSAKASKLVETLGRLPLALEQACAYVSNLSCDLTEYVEHYKKFSLKLLDEENATSVTLCESPQRLTVRTTWLLNFDYIKKSTKGNIAVRFLYACAFFNSNEIQQELINPGKPPIEDEAYREYVDTPLGSSHILKLLTDFSLFKKGKSSSLTVHHLVQEVIREELKSNDAEISSLVDAIRFLSFAFSKCPSPGGLVDSDIKSRHDRASISATNPFLFHTWQTLCLHAQEVLSNLKSFQVLDERILGPETARIIYEFALHLNVRSKTDEARECFNFAHKIIDLSKAPLTESELASLFPREVPLPESLRRYIFYSCATPRDSTDSSTSDRQEKTRSKRKMEEMHVNSDFRKAMAEANSVEPNLLYDRALAYIHSKEYKNALAESEDYILKRPTCWLGFCIKALALYGLNNLWEANSFAALAFYYNRNVFRECQLFNDVFSSLEKRIHICDTSSRLTGVLMKQTSQLQADSESPSRIIIIEPGDYVVNCDDLSIYSSHVIFKGPLSFGLLIDDCILLGVDRTKSSVVTLKNSDSGLWAIIGEACLDRVFWRNVMVSNISFFISGGNWESQSDSIATWTNCSFSSILEEDKSNIFRCLGTDTFRSCKFENCAGLLTLGRTVLQKCVFSGSEYSGVHVNTSARLEMKECKVFGNETGIFICKAPESCNVTNCDIFDNKLEGVSIHEATTNVKVENCRIYQNNCNGISVEDFSSAIVSKNEIFENGWNGISTVCNGRCTVSHNKIYGNKFSGVQVVPVEKPFQPSIVQFNEIFENRGHGIYCEMIIQDTPTDTSVNLSTNGLQQLIHFNRNTDMFERAKCNENKCYNNEDQDRSHKSDDYSDYCFYCRKKCSKKCSKICKKCEVTTYCNKECQKHDREKHNKECRGLLNKFTVCLNIPKKEPLEIVEHGVFGPEKSPQQPGLAVKGELFFSPPKSGDTFLVKLVAADEEWHSNSDGPVFTICDRSRTINGVLDRKCYSELFNIVRECGISGTVVNRWKKKFFWARLHEKDQTKLRVFVTKFPPHQDW